MPFLTIASIVVIISYAIYSRVNTDISPKQQEPEVLSDVDQAATPTLSSSPTLAPTSTPKPNTPAKIEVQVDSQLNGVASSSEKLIYPGATKVRTDGSTEIYESGADGDTVYNWYKSEFDKRSYNIRNNVRTKANDKFKAVLQGVSESSSLKVTIDQENAGAKTTITIE